MLNTVVEKRDDLRKELERNDKIESILREEIAKASQQPPNHPIITFPSIEEEDEEDHAPNKDVENKQTQEDTPSTPTDVRALDQENAQVVKPETQQESISLGMRLQSNILDLDDTELADFSYHGIGDPMAFPFCVSPDRAISSPSLPGYRRTGSNESLNELGYGCTAFLGAGVHLFDADGPRNENLLPASPTPRRPRSSSDGEHQHLQPNFTSSFDTVDFRTGLSGHRGLQNTHTPHSPNPRGRAATRYLMSVHDGIGAHVVHKKHSPREQQCAGKI